MITYQGVTPLPVTASDESGPAGLSFVIAARNEETTIEKVVGACFAAGRELKMWHEVIVVSDHSSDATAAVAARSGAIVVARQSSRGSKAAALSLGVERARGSLLFFVDADLVGVTGECLAEIGRQVIESGADMAVGTFDYRRAGGLVQRVPWSTGERVLHRDLFDTSDPRMSGYNVELLINEAVGRRNGRVVSVRMKGVRQRNKAAKFGRVRGSVANLRMWREISTSVPRIDRSAYLRYAQEVQLFDPLTRRTRPQARAFTTAAFFALCGLSRALRSRHV